MCTCTLFTHTTQHNTHMHTRSTMGTHTTQHRNTYMPHPLSIPSQHSHRLTIGSELLKYLSLVSPLHGSHCPSLHLQHGASMRDDHREDQRMSGRKKEKRRRGLCSHVSHESCGWGSGSAVHRAILFWCGWFVPFN